MRSFMGDCSFANLRTLQSLPGPTALLSVPSCRNWSLGKAEACLFHLFWGQLASTKRAGIEARRYVTRQYHHTLPPLDRHLGAHRAAAGVGGREAASSIY